jgi:hypothetical protein
LPSFKLNITFLWQRSRNFKLYEIRWIWHAYLFITPYAGFGFTNTNFDLSMTGNYPTLGDPLTVNVGGVLVPRLNENGKPILQIINKPNLINISSNQVLTNATLGLRIKLAVLTLHAQYAFQKYPVASAGFGFSFR